MMSETVQDMLDLVATATDEAAAGKLIYCPCCVDITRHVRITVGPYEVICCDVCKNIIMFRVIGENKNE